MSAPWRGTSSLAAMSASSSARRSLSAIAMWTQARGVRPHPPWAWRWSCAPFQLFVRVRQQRRRNGVRHLRRRHGLRPQGHRRGSVAAAMWPDPPSLYLLGNKAEGIRVGVHVEHTLDFIFRIGAEVYLRFDSKFRSRLGLARLTRRHRLLSLLYSIWMKQRRLLSLLYSKCYYCITSFWCFSINAIFWCSSMHLLSYFDKFCNELQYNILMLCSTRLLLDLFYLLLVLVYLMWCQLYHDR